jgi:protocatechuate 3,4-dioxygenase beta subunit
VKIWSNGREKLTTQLYFEGDPYNETDPWYDPTRALALADQPDGSLSTTLDFTISL